MSVDSVGRRVSRGGGLVVRPQAIRFFNHLTKCFGLVCCLKCLSVFYWCWSGYFAATSPTWKVWWAFYMMLYRRQVNLFCSNKKICISITSSCVCQRFPLFLSFMSFLFQFARYFRLLEVFELEKFYKQREQPLQSSIGKSIRNSAQKRTWLLLGVVNNFLCCTLSL